MLYPWQQLHWQRFTQQHRDERLHHAYIISGMKGLGQFAFAEHCAAWLLCEKKLATDRCHHCKSCKLLQAANHPDLIHLLPEEGKKSISIAAIRELTTAIDKTSNQGGYQIVIIEPAEAMTIAAANALLKTLEEPIGQVLFMLVNYEVGRLPMTIKSRCQRLSFVANRSAETWLLQQLPHLDPKLALNLAKGAPLLALEQQSSGFNDSRQLVWQQIAAVLAKQTTWQAASKALKDVDNLTILVIMLSLVTDLLKQQLGVLSSQLDNIDLIAPLSVVSIPIERLLELHQQLETVRRLLQRGAGVNFDLQLLNIWRLWHG